MGRTVPTFTMVLQQEIESWGKFRRGLRREDQDALDELFRAARFQLAGSAYAARPIPFESVIMSMMVMQQRMIRDLQRSIAAPGGRFPVLPSPTTLPPVREEGTDDNGADNQRVAV